MVDLADPWLMNQVFKPQNSCAQSPWSQSGELMFNDPFKQFESAWNNNNNDYKNGTWNFSETISKDQFSLNISFKPDTTGGDIPVSQPGTAAPGDSGTGSTAGTGTAAGSDTGSSSSSPLNPTNDAALQNLSNTGDSQLQQTLINAFSDVNNGKLSADAYQQFENAAIPLTNTNGQYPNDTVLSEAALAQVAPQLSASDVADLQTLIISSDGSSSSSSSGSDSGATGGSDGSGASSGTDSGATGSGSKLAGFSTHFGQYGAGYGDPIATVDNLAQDGVNMIRDDFAANNSAEKAAFTQAVQDGMRPLMIVESVADMQKAINEYKDLKTADGKSVLANMNFEFMNEPNPAKVDPAAYAANATQASELLKAASPTSEFLIGAQAYWDFNVI